MEAMNYFLTKKQEERLENFKTICRHFVGSKAMLFAYNPGLQELEILIEKENKLFLLKFVHTLSIKVCKEWNFADLDVEIKIKHNVQKHSIEYRFSDREYFEVRCLFFGVSELLNGQEVLNYENW